MRAAIVGSFAIVTITLMATHGVVGQEPVPYDARAGVRLMRAINTAENAGRRTDGYVAIERLLTHPMMGGVAQSVVLDGHDATYLGQSLRLVVSGDGQHYQAALVPPSECGVAVFTDERGLIFTGKVIGCP